MDKEKRQFYIDREVESIMRVIRGGMLYGDLIDEGNYNQVIFAAFLVGKYNSVRDDKWYPPITHFHEDEP